MPGDWSAVQCSASRPVMNFHVHQLSDASDYELSRSLFLRFYEHKNVVIRNPGSCDELKRTDKFCLRKIISWSSGESAERKKTTSRNKREDELKSGSIKMMIKDFLPSFMFFSFTRDENCTKKFEPFYFKTQSSSKIFNNSLTMQQFLIAKLKTIFSCR